MAHSPPFQARIQCTSVFIGLNIPYIREIDSSCFRENDFPGQSGLGSAPCLLTWRTDTFPLPKFPNFKEELLYPEAQISANTRVSKDLYWEKESQAFFRDVALERLSMFY